ncbi:MAG: hypothetical protein HYR63_13160 [Proteobacteria bacterium]|nr:hypothetical protein [Pseudomonadota bacterium]MBI3496955.1 hypothetical protein [Pseudomonadota bacterium]
MTRVLVIDDDSAIREVMNRILSDAGYLVACASDGRVGNMDFLSLAVKFGANRTLAKPFTRTALLEAIRDVAGQPGSQPAPESGSNSSTVNLSRG